MVAPTRSFFGLFASALLMAGALLVTPLSGQATPDASGAPKKCYDCKGTGLLPCPGKDCKQDKVCGTKIPHKCDAIYSAECCRGTQKILCPKCKDPIVAAELQAELDARKAWVEEMRKVDRGAQTRFCNIETDHWIFHCSLPAWKIKINENEVTYSRVRAAHLWAERLEENSVFISKILGRFPEKKQIGNLVASPIEAMRVSLTTQGVGHDRPFNLFGYPTGVFTTLPHEEFVTDELVHPHVMHEATHVQVHATGLTREHFMQSWFHEAFAHYVEIARFKAQRTFCQHEVGRQKDPWQLADWKKQIYGEVASRKDEPLAMIMTRDLDRQTFRDRAHGWAFLEFLIKTRKPEEFQKFFDTLKESDGDTKKALQAAYGWSTAAFQEKWREYVLKNWAP